MGSENPFYTHLVRCIKIGRVDIWNNMRRNRPDVVIQLDDSGFSGLDLSEVDLGSDRKGIVSLRNTTFNNTRINNTNFSNAKIVKNLNKVEFNNVEFEQVTLDPLEAQDIEFKNCRASRCTTISNYLMETALIDPMTKSLFQYIKRLHNWTEWRKQHKKLSFFALLFWWPSDYGRSVLRLLLCFIGTSILFSLLYLFLHQVLHWDVIKNLTSLDISSMQIIFRSWYFSMVTMTTLGFGDMCVEPNSIWGYVLVMLQVLTGYLYLGGAITVIYSNIEPVLKPYKKKKKSIFDNLLYLLQIRE